MALFPIDVVIKPDQAVAGASQVRSALGGIDTAGTRTLNTIDRLESRVKQLAIAFATVKLVGLIKEAALLSQRFNELGLAMGVVGRNVNVSRAAMAATEKSLQSLGISMIESRQTILRLASANIDLKNATELADLARNAAIVGQINTSEALNRIVLGVSNASLTTLRSVGIVTTFDTAYKKLAEELGKNITHLTDAEKQQARLNAVLEKAPALLGLYEESMLNAGKQLRSTDRLVENLQVKIGGLFDSTALLAVSQYTGALKDLTGQTEKLIESGDLARYGDQIARSFALAGDAIVAVTAAMRVGTDLAITGFRQLVALTNLDLNKANALGEDFFKRQREEFSVVGDLTRALEGQISARNNLAEATKQAETGAFGLSAITQFQADATNRLIVAEEKLASAVVNKVKGGTSAADAAKTLLDAQNNFIDSLIKEQEELGKTTVEVRKLEAARLGLGKPVFDQIDNLDKSTKSLDANNSEMMRAAEITESVLTPQEKYNRDLFELHGFLDKGSISTETFGRAVANLDKVLAEASQGSKGLFRNVEQFGIQAARSVQRSFAQILIDPKGSIVKQFGNIAKKAAAEFSSAFTLSGIENLFNGNTFSGSGKIQPGGEGATNRIAGFLQKILDVGKSTKISSEKIEESSKITSGSLSSIVDKTRFTVNPTAGALAVTGGSLAGSGTGVTALAGAAATFGGPIGMGIAAGVIVTDFLDRKFGDFELTGFVNTAAKLGRLGDFIGAPLNKFAQKTLGLNIPDPNTLILKALFGRGPFKQKETSLLGDVTAEGFEGATSARFRSKGGAFRGNRTDRILTDVGTGELLSQFGDLIENGLHEEVLPFVDGFRDASIQLGTLLNTSIRDITQSARDSAESLGLGTSAIDSFSRSVELVSEKGEFLTNEAISQELSRIADEMAEGLIPNLNSLRQAGETSAQAMSRISGETDLLVTALSFMNVSVKEARSTILGFGIDLTTDLVDRLGGGKKFAEDLDFFTNTFLSTQEKLTPLFQQLDIDLGKLGFSAGITRTEFKNLVQSFDDGEITFKQFSGLLNLQRDFDAVKSLQEELIANSGGVVEAERTLIDVRRELEQAYQRERNELEQTADKFDNFSRGIREFRQGLLLGELSTLDPQARLDEARTQFNRTRALATQGDENAISRLPDVSRAFLEASKDFNASSQAFASDFSIVQDVLLTVEDSTKTQADLARDQLSALDRSVSGIISIDDSVRTTNSLLREMISLQNSTVPKSIANANTIQIGSGGGSSSVTSFPSPSPISDAAIRAYAAANPNLSGTDIYSASIANNVSPIRSAKVLGYSDSQIQQFFADNPSLPPLRTGVNYLPSDMVIQAHAGEEIRPYKQVQADADNQKAVVVELKALVRLQAAANAELIKDIKSVRNSTQESARAQRRGNE